VVVLELITSIILDNMAQCRNCGMKVGCGCQLINGLCGACNATIKQGIKRFKNVITKISQLY
jgi:hypothetical protein